MIELNQSWAGPYHRMPLARWMLVHPITGIEEPNPDPNADLYDAIPWAKDAGLELVDNDPGVVYMIGADHWCKEEKKWIDHTEDVEVCCCFPTREAALKSPPPMPPGYVAAKPTTLVPAVTGCISKERMDAVFNHPAKPDSSLLDELAEVLRKASNELTHDARFFHNIALAVARRLLERGPSEAEVKDAVEEWQKEARALDDYCRVIISASRLAQLAELEGK